MAQDLLKSYLVQLGFAVDSVTKGRFDDAVSGATSSINKLGLSIGATTASVVLGTEVMAAQMEKLFFQSRLTGATVEGLQDLAFGAQRVGVSADQALGALQKFSLQLQFDPSKAGLLAGLGIRGSNVEELFHNFVTRMGELPPQIRVVYEQMFGQDPATIEMMIRGQAEMDKAAENMADIHKRYGFNAKKAASDAHDFQNAWNDTWARVTTIAQLGAQEAEPYIKKYLLEPLDEALDKLGELRKKSGGFGPAVKDNVESGAVRDWLGDRWHDFVDHEMDLLTYTPQAMLLNALPTVAQLRAAGNEQQQYVDNMMGRGGDVTVTTTIHVAGNMDEHAAREVSGHVDDTNKKLLAHLSGKGAPQ